MMTVNQMSEREKMIADIREALRRVELGTYRITAFADLEYWLRFLLSELDRIQQEYAEERAAHNAHVTELCELEQERDKLIEVLRWYADEENQKLDEGTRHWENVYSPYEMDGGQRARDILKEIGVTVK